MTSASPLSADWAGRETDSLLWIASFPRSGNTFLRILLANYFASGDGAYDINALFDFVPSDTSGALWKRFSSDMAGPSTLERTWSLRPDFIRSYRKTLTASSFPGLKTHTAKVTISGQSGFDFKPNDRVIYIVRHPLDVLLSYADYTGQDVDATLKMMTTPGSFIFSPDHGGAIDLRGSWPQHVSSWLDTPPCPLLLIRFEELCGTTEKSLLQILTFLGAPIVSDRVARAVAASQFDRVREQEASNRFVETPATAKSGTFFRSGATLQWLRGLNREQANSLADGCGDIMQRLGYTHPSEVDVDGGNALRPVNLAGTL
jgi:hypothetical protein